MNHSAVIESEKNYSFKALFENYQGRSVSIEISAKCKEIAIMRFGAKTLFFETKCVSAFEIFHSFVQCCFFFYFETVFCGVQNRKGKLIFREIDITHVWHFVYT